MKNVYTDSTEEYRALRGSCGLLDHDQASLVTVSGPDSAAFLGETSTRSVDFLLEGQSSSALLLTRQGTVITEVLIHCRAEGYLVEITGERAQAAAEHLLAEAARFPDASVADVSNAHAVIAVEGPGSFRTVAPYVGFPISAMAYRTFATGTYQEGSLLVSRTGVTGEYGYTLIVAAAQADALRIELLAAGAVPCGSDALDTCRMEMRFTNPEREGGGAALTPFDYGLQWMVDFSHEFTGRQALQAAWQVGEGRVPVCWMADAGDDDDTSSPEGGLELTLDGTSVGTVSHAVYSPSLGRVIGTARVDRAVAGSGLAFALGASDRAVQTISAPFLVATSFGVPME